MVFTQKLVAAPLEFATTESARGDIDEGVIMHKGLALLATIFTMFTFVAFGAQAMPVSKLKSVSVSSAQIMPVAQGCGRYRYRGPRGRCHY